MGKKIAARIPSSVADETIRYITERTANDPDNVGIVMGSCAAAFIAICTAAKVDPFTVLRRAIQIANEAGSRKPS